MSKYTTNEEESQCLPNRLGLTRPGEIAEAEFEGFLLAEIMLTETLTTATRFDCQYIRNIHKLALKELYTFAGRYRTVNMSKGGFLFPSALFIPQSMQFFEDEILKKLPDTYPDKGFFSQRCSHRPRRIAFHPSFSGRMADGPYPGESNGTQTRL